MDKDFEYFRTEAPEIVQHFFSLLKMMSIRLSNPKTTYTLSPLSYWYPQDGNAWKGYLRKEHHNKLFL